MNCKIIKTLKGYEFVQRLNDGFINVTYLLKQSNRANNDNRQAKDFLKTKEAQIKISELTGSNMDLDDGKFFEKDSGGVWLHPILLMDFTKWMDQQLKVSLVEWNHGPHKRKDIVKLY